MGSSDFGGRNRHANNWGDDHHLRSKYTGHLLFWRGTMVYDDDDFIDPSLV
jgi:hypothetical protein